MNDIISNLVKIDGHEYEVTVTEMDKRDRTQPTWENNRYYRQADHNAKWREYETKPRAYFWVDGESVLDHLVNRRYEPFKAYRAVLPAVMEQLRIKTSRCNWSKHAGCTMCPCSPGFVLTLDREHVGHPHFDVFVKVSITPRETAPDLGIVGAADALRS